MSRRTITHRRPSRSQSRTKVQGSIGLAWPPMLDRTPIVDGVTGSTIARGNDRIKGMVPYLLTNNNAERILGEVADMGREVGVSRITLRAIVAGQDFERVMEIAGRVGLPIEASIPLGSGYNNTYLVYFGRNDLARTVAEEVRVEQAAIVEDIMQRTPESSEDLRNVLTSNGYSLDQRVNTTNGDLGRLVELYRLCLPRYLLDLNEDNIREAVDNPDNLVLVIRNGGRIISSAIAERAVTKVDGENYPLVELSECVTDPNHRQEGLMSVLLFELIQRLEQGSIIYSESRAPDRGINTAIRKAGLVYAGPGTLQKHCVIGERESLEGTGGHEEKENLNVWYMRSE